MPFKFSFSAPLWDVVLLAALAAYIFAGVPLVTFHGDEGMQIYATRDYITAVVERDPLALMTAPPYPIDSRPHLRIINGSVQRYAAGAVLHSRGYTLADLPIEPGWNWGLSYADNVAGSWLPSDHVLHTARYTSAAFLALSLVPLYGVGRLLGGRWVAYSALVLYALNPLVLLNGRRAMMEGSLLCFGLLAVWFGALIARAAHERQRVPVWLWGVLALAGALALASKHSAALFLVGAWGWAGIGVLLARTHLWRRLALLTLTGLLAIGGFVALSPALWNNPPARLADLVRLRGELLELQVLFEPDGATTTAERVVNLVTTPYTVRPQHYERPDWAAPLATSEARYAASVWRGLPSHWLTGAAVWLLVGLGAVWVVRRAAPGGVGLLWWFGVTLAALMLNPLPWARYSLPLIPLLALLAGGGVRWIVNKLEQN